MRHKGCVICHVGRLEKCQLYVINEWLSALYRLDDKCCISIIFSIEEERRLWNSQFNRLQSVRQTFYSETEITLGGLSALIMRTIYDSIQNQHKAVRTESES